MLLCHDVQASIVFYVDKLGFTVCNREDDIGRSGFASLRRGKAQIMLASPSYIPLAQKIDGRLTQAIFYFYPEDVRELHRSLKEKGVQVTELTERFYGLLEFETTDPDGHILAFGQEPR